MNLHLIQGVDVEYGSIQESLAIQVWRKQQRIDLYKTIALATASINPEKAQGAIRRLLEEMFPEVGKDREKAVDKAMEIMDKERKKSYAVAAVGDSLNKGAFGKLRNIMKAKKRPGR